MSLGRDPQRISSKLRFFNLFLVKFFWTACFHYPTGRVDAVLSPIPLKRNQASRMRFSKLQTSEFEKKANKNHQNQWWVDFSNFQCPVAMPHNSTLHFSWCSLMRWRTSSAMGPLPAGNTVGQYEDLVRWTHFRSPVYSHSATIQRPAARSLI